MKSYKKQRFQNKVAYEHLVEAIAEEIVEHQLKEVNTPFNEKFWHILQTLQGALLSKHNIKSHLDTKTQDDFISVILTIDSMY